MGLFSSGFYEYCPQCNDFTEHGLLKGCKICGCQETCSDAYYRSKGWTIEDVSNDEEKRSEAFNAVKDARVIAKQYLSLSSEEKQELIEKAKGLYDSLLGKIGEQTVENNKSEIEFMNNSITSALTVDSLNNTSPVPSNVTSFLGLVGGADSYNAVGLIGEALTQVNSLYSEALNKAYRNMITNAKAMGADTVINIQVNCCPFQYSSGQYVLVSCSGMAVKVK